MALESPGPGRFRGWYPEDGQVVVSTGKIGTGFIKLNANPNDIFTPYIDIVERTGSAVYDIDLKGNDLEVNTAYIFIDGNIYDNGVLQSITTLESQGRIKYANNLSKVKNR